MQGQDYPAPERCKWTHEWEVWAYWQDESSKPPPIGKPRHCPYQGTFATHGHWACRLPTFSAQRNKKQTVDKHGWNAQQRKGKKTQMGTVTNLEKLVNQVVGDGGEVREAVNVNDGSDKSQVKKGRWGRHTENERKRSRRGWRFAYLIYDNDESCWCCRCRCRTACNNLQNISQRWSVQRRYSSRARQ